MPLIYEDPYGENEAELRRREQLGIPRPTGRLLVQPNSDETSADDNWLNQSSGMDVGETVDSQGQRKRVRRGDDGMLYAAMVNDTARELDQSSAAPQPPSTMTPRNRESDIITAGLKYKDTPYLMGAGRGASVPDAIDCSAFVARAYQDATGGAVKLTPFTDTMANESQLIPEQNARSGDLVFYRGNDPDQPGVQYPHVGIYAGNGMILDASSSTGKVSLHKLAPPSRYKLEFRRVQGASATNSTVQQSAGGTMPTAQPSASNIDQYDTYTGAFQLPTGPTPEQIAEQVRREQERLALAAKARRRAWWQDWIGQNAGQAYESPITDLNWFGRGQ